MACGCVHSLDVGCVCSDTCAQQCWRRHATVAPQALLTQYRTENTRLRNLVRQAIARVEALRGLAIVSGVRYDAQLLGDLATRLRIGLEQTGEGAQRG